MTPNDPYFNWRTSVLLPSGGKGNSLIPPLRFPHGRFGGIRSFLRVN
jgi:hypothetical protein